ncbi:MAG: hypothetical protein AAB354_08195 [candidate division KSB1 bacterium]
MSALEYLVWILIVGLSCFIVIRLTWLYETKPHHLFWRKPQARHYFLSAVLLLFAAFFILPLALNAAYLIPLLLGFYLFSASAAVKVSERGIMSNGLFAAWSDIVNVQRLAGKNQILVKTAKRWRQLRFEVPDEIEPKLRKVFASKRIAWSEPPADTMPLPGTTSEPVIA